MPSRFLFMGRSRTAPPRWSPVRELVLIEPAFALSTGLRSRGGPLINRPPLAFGEVPEWSIGTVSKTVVRASVPWVRIPPSPPPEAAPSRATRITAGSRRPSRSAATEPLAVLKRSRGCRVVRRPPRGDWRRRRRRHCLPAPCARRGWLRAARTAASRAQDEGRHRRSEVPVIGLEPAQSCQALVTDRRASILRTLGSGCPPADRRGHDDLAQLPAGMHRRAGSPQRA